MHKKIYSKVVVSILAVVMLFSVMVFGAGTCQYYDPMRTELERRLDELERKLGEQAERIEELERENEELKDEIKRLEHELEMLRLIYLFDLSDPKTGMGHNCLDGCLKWDYERDQCYFWTNHIFDTICWALVDFSPPPPYHVAISITFRLIKWGMPYPAIEARHLGLENIQDWRHTQFRQPWYFPNQQFRQSGSFYLTENTPETFIAAMQHLITLDFVQRVRVVNRTTFAS